MKSYFSTQEIEDYLEMADSALEYIMKATRPGLCDADRYFYVGRICDFFYCPESALAAYNQAIENDPNHVETLYELAEIDSCHGKHKEAIEKYKKLICLDPGNARAYMEIAQIYEYFLPDAMKVIEAFKEAIRCDPSHAAAHLHLGLVYLKIGDIKSAEEEREKLRLLRSDLANESHWTIGDDNALSKITYTISPNQGGN